MEGSDLDVRDLFGMVTKLYRRIFHQVFIEEFVTFEIIAKALDRSESRSAPDGLSFALFWLRIV